jgi:GT2 family glycosyltransferase
MDVQLSVVVPATNRPQTLPHCLVAIRGAAEAPEEVVVVEEPPLAGPARARNLGAASAGGDVIVFVDADVAVHPDAFALIRRAFAEDQRLTAMFGSYDDRPAADTVVSAFRNLLHHHVHHSSPGEATTFWAGLGAVRREAFFTAGGFDERRYERPSIEDIELGIRLVDSGARIRLEPRLLGTHLKRWTLAEMVRTDFARRGVPWVVLLLSRGSASSALNLGWRHRLSSLAAATIAAGAILRRLDAIFAGLAALLALNASFYRLLVRRRGPAEAAAGVGLHLIHHLIGLAALFAGTARYLLGPYRKSS